MKRSMHARVWLVLLAAACSAKQAPASIEAGSMAPARSDAWDADDASESDDGVETPIDELARLEDELRQLGVPPRLEDELRQLGVPLDEEERARQAELGDPAATDSETKERCARICELSEATCDLHDKICDLASEHATDPRYADACTRADDDCRYASEACRACSA